MAQSPIHVREAQLSIPFESPAEGELVLVDNYLLFIDESKPEASFAIPRANIKNMSFMAERMVSVTTTQPVEDRSGERSVFSFRVNDGIVPIQNWYSAKPEVTTSGIPSPRMEVKPPLTYAAQHDHFLGSCQGTLTITDTRITYESPDQPEHSRQWQLRDLKEVKQRGPYVFEVVPLIGSQYNFKLKGAGMDVKDFKALQTWISAARAGR